MDPQLDELNRKIDALTTQVAYLAEQAREAERMRRSGEELLETAMPIARGAMDMVSTQLEEVQDYLDPDDLVRLLKKLIRHTPQIEMLLDQLDAVTDLIDVVGPITKEGMDKITAVTEDLDRKGYFALGRGGMRMLDNIVCNVSEKDVNGLGDQVMLILDAVKKPVDSSLGSLIKLMNDPAVRRGLALSLRVLQVVGKQAA